MHDEAAQLPAGTPVAHDLRALRAELVELRRCFDTWAALPGNRRGGTPAMKLVEEPLREFFGRISSDGISVGTGDRPALNPRYPSDMDIVFDYDGDAWVGHLRMGADAAPVLAHLDVSGRSDWDSTKFKQDLERIQRTISEARGFGSKTWTGLVAVGPGFRHRCEEVMRAVHEAHHEQEVDRWDSANAGSVWPFVDAVIVPGMLLKKHDLFASRDLDSERHPVLYPFFVGDMDGLGELWPLVAARAFLAAYLRRVAGLESWETPAWSPAETAALLGGAPTSSLWREPWRVIAMQDEVPFELHHWSGNDTTPWQDHVLHAEAACSRGKSFLMLPRPVFSMTDERRNALLAVLRENHRWSLLGDDGSRLIAELVFPDSLVEEIEQIVRSATALGYVATAHERLVKHKEPVSDTRLLTIEATDSMPNTPEAIATRLRDLRALLGPNLPRAGWLAAPLQLEPVLRWLDGRYGESAWSFDPNAVLTKSVGNGVVFVIRETTRNDALVLVVLGDDVELLPATFDWPPFG